MNPKQIALRFNLLSFFFLLLAIPTFSLWVSGLVSHFPLEIYGVQFSGLAANITAIFAVSVFGLAALSRQVAKNPEYSEWAAPLIAMILLGFAYVRFLSYFFQPDLAELKTYFLSETVFFSFLALWVGLSRTSATTRGFMALVMDFMKKVLRLPPVLQIWLLFLTVATFVFPFFDLDSPGMNLLLIGQVINVPFGFLLFEYAGISRLLGLTHLFNWTPALAFLILEAATQPVSPWVILTLSAAGISIAFDVVDSIRWLNGDRAHINRPLNA